MQAGEGEGLLTDSTTGDNNDLLINASDSEIQNILKNIGVLQLDFWPKFGGGPAYKINLYELLNKNHCPVVMFFGGDDLTAYELSSRNLPFNSSTIPGSKLSIKRTNNRQAGAKEWGKILVVAREAEAICRKNNIQIIHCHSPLEVHIAKLVAKKIPIKIVVTVHSGGDLSPWSLNRVHGAIGVNHTITHTIMKTNKSTAGYNIKKIAWVAPFVDEQRFLHYQPSMTRTNFFKEIYNIHIKNVPIITSVSNFYPCKNQAVLIKAVANLIITKKRPVELILAGLGSQLETCRSLAHELGIQDYVHFVGNTNKIPDLLFHSDIKVMASSEDAFPIAVMEAACMNKPVIGTYGTGMIHMIKHEKTGLLFDHKSPDALVHSIERYLDNPDFAHACAKNLYNHWKCNFSSNASLRKLVAVYLDCLK